MLNIRTNGIPYGAPHILKQEVIVMKRIFTFLIMLVLGLSMGQQAIAASDPDPGTLKVALLPD